MAERVTMTTFPCTPILRPNWNTVELGVSADERVLLNKKTKPAESTCNANMVSYWILCIAILVFLMGGVSLVFIVLVLVKKVDKLTEGLGGDSFPSMDQVGEMTKVLVASAADTAMAITQIATDTESLVHSSSVSLKDSLNTTQHMIERMDNLVSNPPELKLGLF